MNAHRRIRPLLGPLRRPPLLTALLGLVVWGCSPPSSSPDVSEFAGVGLPGDVRLPDIGMEIDPGVRSSLPEVLDGTVNFVFIGYTYCPDICPVHLANLGAVLRALPLEVAREVEVAFVTADPARDTHERVDEWLAALDSRFHGFRPTREEVNRLEDALDVPRSVVDPEETGGSYLVAHAGQVIAFDENGIARAAYPWGIRQRNWQRDIPRLVRGEWPAIDSIYTPEVR
ncbi:MAG TPA: SCO family protein [Longimicrobiales bacterium]|nr:SCO family protein [Longimicrobiales bacterium]